MLQAVLFDVDFTIAKPGPELGPEGYKRLGERFGLELDPSRYREAREKAVEGIRRHPELEHDEEIWVAFTERIIRGMGGGSGSAYECAVAMTKAWEHAEHFELYEDALPVLEELRGHGLKLGPISTSSSRTTGWRSTRCSDRARSAGRSRTRRSSRRSWSALVSLQPTLR